MIERFKAPVLVGSLAASLQFSDWVDSFGAPIDLDLIGHYKEVAEFLNEKLELKGQPNIYTEGEASKLIIHCDCLFLGAISLKAAEAQLVWNETSDADIYDAVVNGGHGYFDEDVGAWIAHPEILLLLKASHKYKKNSPHFLKTMRHIQFFKKNGVVVPDTLLALLKKREKETYSYKHPSLNQQKASFFSGDGITYIWDHDTIHESVKLHERPAYTYYLIPGEQVKCSKELFYAQSEEIRLAGALEEALTLALERSQISHMVIKDGITPPTADWSFEFALFKVCTSITSGWFRAYCWDNYDKVVALYHETSTGYADQARLDIEMGKIKPFEGSLYA